MLDLKCLHKFSLNKYDSQGNLTIFAKSTMTRSIYVAAITTWSPPKKVKLFQKYPKIAFPRSLHCQLIHYNIIEIKGYAHYAISPRSPDWIIPGSW